MAGCREARSTGSIVVTFPGRCEESALVQALRAVRFLRGLVPGSLAKINRLTLPAEHKPQCRGGRGLRGSTCRDKLGHSGLRHGTLGWRQKVRDDATPYESCPRKRRKPSIRTASRHCEFRDGDLGLQPRGIRRDGKKSRGSRKTNVFRFGPDVPLGALVDIADLRSRRVWARRRGRPDAALRIFGLSRRSM